MSARPLLASSYSGIERRGEKLDAVRRELNTIINALPTQVHPTERELYLDALLEDLGQGADAPWTVWPEDLYTLALTAIKFLGRNPVGSETLLTKAHFSVLLYHSGLPGSSSLSSRRGRPIPNPASGPARESMKVLANLLVLYEEARNTFSEFEGAKAVARALAGKGVDREDVSVETEAEEVEKLFLLGRLGFLVTLGRSQAARIMVDEEDVVESLATLFTAFPPIASNQGALSELLKLANNLFRFYPYSCQSSQSPLGSSDIDQWDQSFDPLLSPILCLFHSIPFIDLAPPLSQAIHALLSIPFIPRLLPTWHSSPNPPSPVPSSAAPSPTSSVKTLLAKLGNLSTSNYTPRKSSNESLNPTIGSGKPESSGTSRRSSGGDSTSRPTVPPLSVHNAVALPSRLLRIFDHFFDTYIPFPKRPDDPLPQGPVLEESLPPLLLLLTRAAIGSEPIRVYLKERLLPSTVDRSPEAGPLEGRKGTLGNILRLMGCAGHAQCRNTAGELMWAICKGDAADLCVEIGYGNAAGLLFQKGLSGPPPAKVEKLPSDEGDVDVKSSTRFQVEPASPIASTHTHAQGPHFAESSSSSTPASASTSEVRNPITSLRPENAGSGGSHEMTQEEKEREAERLFVLFERMEKNPVISMRSDDDEQGKGKKVNMMDMMREKLEKGDFESDDARDAEYERKEREKQDERDERQALKEIEEYKKRMGRK